MAADKEKTAKLKALQLTLDKLDKNIRKRGCNEVR